MSDPATLSPLLAPPRAPHRKAVGLHGLLGVRWWSRERLHRAMRTAAARWTALGARRGDHVVIAASSSPEWAAAFLGALGRGLVTVAVDPSAGVDEARRAAETVGARWIVTDLETVDETPAGPTVLPISTLFDGPPAVAPWAIEPRPSDPAIVLFSSGSEGPARPVRLTHGNLAAQLAPFRGWRHLLRIVPLRALSMAPLSHVLGLVVGLLLPLEIGLAVVWTNEPESRRWADLIRRHRISVMVAVPRVLEALRDLATMPPVAPRRGPIRAYRARGRLLGRFLFRLFLVGGGRLGADVERYWRRAGVAVVQGYGLTETAAFVTIGRPFGGAGSIGRTVGGQEVRLAADGEILVRGPNVAEGVDDADGFFPTGDLGRRDARGRLIFTGRKKATIVTADGVNIDPGPIERLLRAQPGVRDAAVIGRAHRGSEEVHAVLVLDAVEAAAAAVASVNQSLTISHRVRSWSPWPGTALPRGPLGKLRRYRVQAALASGTERREGPAVPSPVPAQTAATATDLLALDPAARLAALVQWIESPALDSERAALGLAEDLGLSSVDAVALLSRLESRRPAGGAALVADDVTTVGDLRDQLHGGPDADRPDDPPRIARLPIRQPWWSATLVARPLRAAVRTATLGLWALFGHRVRAVGADLLDGTDGPLIFACAPHRHWQDGFAVYRALPRRFRRRLLVVTNRDFAPAFAPSVSTPWRERLAVAAAYWCVVPSLFPFTILAPWGRAREGLVETAGWIGRGWCPLTFPQGMRWYGRPDLMRQDPGAAWIAADTGTSLVPVALSGNDDLGWHAPGRRRAITVRFAKPIAPRPGKGPDELMAALDSVWATLGVTAD